MTATAGSPADSHFETGSLTKRAPEQSEFVGSSSGVHFIKLVRAVCADRLATDNPDASSSLRVGDVLEGDDDDSDATDRYQNPNSPTSHPPRMTETISNNYLATLDMHSSMPSYMEARAMVVQYFELWHPLLPFLYGPGFMRDFDNLYLGAQSSPQHRPIVAQSRAGCYKFLLCCMFAVMDPKRQIISTSDTLAIVGQLASHNNLLTIQAILMAQLRCVSSMALRTASSHSGLLSRLLLHAGLHRCPFRYEQLDTDSKDMRKRVFWSAYILDRYLSQALGLPPTIADSDVDVCAPGCEELHSPAKSATPASIAKTSRLSRSRSSHASEARNELSTPRAAQVYGIDAARLQEDSPPSPDRNEFLLAHLVTHARLVSQVLELFHKSIHVRSLETDSVLKIRAEANKWFNSLPPWPPGPEEPLRDHLDRVIKPEHAKFVPFLHVLYQQLLIAIHRPYLSLPKTTAEYGNSIQLVIRAARHTITILSLVDEMFWPGYLASAWMSGLVIIFACQTQAYSIDQGTRELQKCLHTLARMQGRWSGAGRCQTALSTLVSSLSKGQSQFNTESPVAQRKRPRDSDGDTTSARSQKRPCRSPSEAANVGGERTGPSPPAAAHETQPSDDPFVCREPLLGLDVGNGHMFPNISWNGDFSSIDDFTLHEFLRDWQG